jgi:subfamily B ATP-binding cassette protein MsbA
LVQEAIDRLLEGRTVFVIAHRLATIQHADRILVLERGQLVEQGTHTDLLARNGAYARLHALQFNRGGE